MHRIQSFLLCVILLIIPFVVLTIEPAYSEESDNITHRHHVALFLGNTQDGSENGFSVGIDYEYRLTELFGIGGLVEYADGDFDSWVAAIPLFIHPYKGFVLLVAPGLEYEDSEDEFLVRTGIAYEIEFGEKWTISPELNVDFVDGEEKFVYGVSVGLKF